MGKEVYSMQCNAMQVRWMKEKKGVEYCRGVSWYYNKGEFILAFFIFYFIYY